MTQVAAESEGQRGHGRVQPEPDCADNGKPTRTASNTLREHRGAMIARCTHDDARLLHIDAAVGRQVLEHRAVLARFLCAEGKVHQHCTSVQACGSESV